jgi:site-specific DNA-methyltransferase (cytosine-N4-specific)
MSTARWLVADVFDGLAQLADNSVDLVMTSPPFLAVRSYLPADHPDKGKEIGAEPTPAAFIDVMLAVVAACDRVLAPHGTLVFELGDTYAGSGGAGGDCNANGLREGQPAFGGSGRRQRAADVAAGILAPTNRPGPTERDNIAGWPLAKSKCLIPELFAVALAYGINPITGTPSPAGRWRIRNMIAWCRTNPPVGALGDKFRPAHSTLIVACRNTNRYFDDIPTRKPLADSSLKVRSQKGPKSREFRPDFDNWTPEQSPAGAPLNDWWVINNTGFNGSHYATYPETLCAPVIASMSPEKVCTICGQPSRRIVETTQADTGRTTNGAKNVGRKHESATDYPTRTESQSVTVGWTDCGHDSWRRGHVLDPFGGTATTLAAAIGNGRDATGIDLDPRNADHAQTRLGMFLKAS